VGKSALELVEEANAMLNVISVEEAQSLIGHSDVVFVDVRDPDSVAETGIIPGGVNAPRGLLEFMRIQNLRLSINQNLTQRSILWLPADWVDRRPYPAKSSRKWDLKTFLILKVEWLLGQKQMLQLKISTNKNRINTDFQR